ncbi:MAG: pantoate--beta-alanine ligase [Gemmatimonadales bacterium]
MEEFTTIAALRERLAHERRNGRRIGFVPTMGFLHDGHLALVDDIRAACDLVVMSIFVNPLQFGPNEDLSRYPRNIERDRGLAASRGVELLFVPTADEMYPPGAEIRVVAGATASRWEGAHRPGHFDGVLTVVAKLFNIVQPDVAGFGQKDIEQVTLIGKMVRDLDVPLALRVLPTVREPDGLALSSRNVYLTPEARIEALSLSQSLRAVEARWRAGERDAETLRAVAAQIFAATRNVTPDYIALADPESLAPVVRAEPGTIVAVAARVGTTRLIDNVILKEPSA